MNEMKWMKKERERKEIYFARDLHQLSSVRRYLVPFRCLRLQSRELDLEIEREWKWTESFRSDWPCVWDRNCRRVSRAFSFNGRPLRPPVSFRDALINLSDRAIVVFDTINPSIFVAGCRIKFEIDLISFSFKSGATFNRISGLCLFESLSLSQTILLQTERIDVSNCFNSFSPWRARRPGVFGLEILITK